MGTNYYIKLKGKEVHIGKLSWGWQFVFQINTDYYKTNKQSINRFLKLHKKDFYDEYGVRVEIDEFWKMVGAHSNGLDLRTYFNYPDCLNFYDPLGDLMPRYEIEFYKDGERIYNILPDKKYVLMRSIENEEVIDGLVFQLSEFD